MTVQNETARPHFLIIRLSSLGDIIHTLPAFASLRENFPGAHITWLVEEKGHEILELVPGIDRVVTADLKQVRLFSFRFFKRFFSLKNLISRRNQTALDFQGLMKSGVYAGISRARKRFGFHPRNLKESGARLFYTRTLDQLPAFMHIIDKNLKLLSLAGIKETRYRFPLRFPGQLTADLSQKLIHTGYEPEQDLVVFNVGAAWKTKQWPAERWIEVIRNLDHNRIFPLILWGTGQEKELAQTIAGSTSGKLAPPLNLQEVLALLHTARLVVSGDTFALQAACALDRPVVALFGPTHPGRNGPFRKRDRVIFHSLDCSYCYKRQCREMTCMEKITASEVLAAVQEMLK